MSRAFPTTTPNITSSDRSKILKQQTIYNNVYSNIKRDVCQKKANKFGSVGYCISDNTVVDPNNSTVNTVYSFTSAKINSTDSYETLYDISKGKSYCSPCNILLNRFDGTNGESSNTLYINPDDVTIADTANNYCSGSEDTQGLPCCGGSASATADDLITQKDDVSPSLTSAPLDKRCNQCGGKTGMIFKVNNIGTFDYQNAIGFISVHCFECDKF